MNTEHFHQKPYQLDLFETSHSNTFKKSLYPVDTDKEKKPQHRSIIKTQRSEIIIKPFPTNKLH